MNILKKQSVAYSIAVGVVLFSTIFLWSSPKGITENTNADTSEEATASDESHVVSMEDEITVIFDGLEITLHSDIDWVSIDHSFSDHHNANVIRLPITVTNLSDHTHGLNMFTFTLFGTAGTTLDTISAYFMDDDISWAGDMRSGATQDSFMHILYDGDGEYVIEFDNWAESVEVIFDVAK